LDGAGENCWERGGFTSLFIADVVGWCTTSIGGGAETAITEAAQLPVNDPLLAGFGDGCGVTEHLGFGVTVFAGRTRSRTRSHGGCPLWII